jgi:hypothetical protein
VGASLKTPSSNEDLLKEGEKEEKEKEGGGRGKEPPLHTYSHTLSSDLVTGLEGVHVGGGGGGGEGEGERNP